MAYNSDDAATRLSAVRDAIDKVLNVQEYQTEDARRVAYAQLKQLRAMEKELQAEVEQASSGISLGHLDAFP